MTTSILFFLCRMQHGEWFQSKTGKIYDTKPKLKIKGWGLSELSAEDLLQLKFDPPMAYGDVLAQATVKSEEIVLELVPGKM